MADPSEGANAAIEGGQETATAPDSTSTEGTTATEKSASESTDSFFDPKDLDESLVPAYKQMQAAYTKKTQALKTDRDKIEAYNAFMSDPQGSIQRLAQQYGYQVGQPGQSQTGESKEWQPNSWDEVIKKAEEKARANLMKELEPVFNEVKKVKKSQIEQVLDDEVPEWRQYEDDMMDMLKAHPSLANDPSKLARLAIPQEVYEGRAMQKALKKLEQKGQSSKVSKGSTTQKNPQLDPNRKLTFAEAVEVARKQVQKDMAS